MRTTATFSHNTDRFALLETDTRARVWDVLSGLPVAIITENQSLKYTCIAWGSDKSKAGDKPRQRKKRRVHVNTELVALGTAVGQIILWDVTKGEICQRLGTKAGEGHSGSVLSITFNSNATKLYTSGEDKRVLEWNVLNGELLSVVGSVGSHAIQQLAISPNDALLAGAGSTSIRIWELSSHQLFAKFTGGHTSRVNSLCFSPDGRLLFSSADNSHFVNQWAIPSTPAVEPTSAAEAVYAAEGHLEFLDVGEVAGSEGGVQRVLLAGTASSVFLWAVDSGERLGRGAIPPTVRLASTPAGSDEQVFAARLYNAVSAMVAHGTAARPRFTQAAFRDGQTAQWRAPNSPAAPLVQLAASGAAAPAGSAAGAAARGTADVKVLGPTDLVLPVPRTALANGVVEGTGKKGPGAEGEATLQQRLQALAVSEPKGRKPRGLAGGATMVGALEQALHTGDVQLLESCIAEGDGEVIRRTVEGLPAGLVGKLLLALVTRFHKSARRGPQLVRWIRAVVTAHATVLLARGPAQLMDALAPLYQLMDARTAVFKKLLKLSGRLDLVLALAAKADRSARVEGVNDVPAVELTEDQLDARVDEAADVDDSEEENEEDDDDEEDNEEEQADEAGGREKDRDDDNREENGSDAEGGEQSSDDESDNMSE